MIPFGFNGDYLLWVMIPSLVLSLAAQFFVRSAYAKWSQARNSMNVNGEQTARIIMQRTSVNGVSLEGVPGQMTDHYDPRSHTVRMSIDNARNPSVAAMAITAHELGHAQQHQENSPLILARNFLVPAVQFSPTIGYIMIFAGLAIGSLQLAWLGVLLFGVMVVFMVLTLPVEIDASMRGMKLLRQAGLLQSEQDASGARQVLTAAALTYFAAAIGAVLQLLYFVSMVNRRN
jgi:Zn-dependent membrane protease YugP